MPAVEARFVWIGGHRLMLLDDGNGRRSLADPVTGAQMTLSRDEIIAAARHAMPGAAMTSARQLDQPDAYWYTLHHTRELPVLRIGFDDPAHTWLHVQIPSDCTKPDGNCGDKQSSGSPTDQGKT